jgi:DNA repair exonuclease SbcCD ATPase subunit
MTTKSNKKSSAQSQPNRLDDGHTTTRGAARQSGETVTPLPPTPVTTISVEFASPDESLRKQAEELSLRMSEQQRRVDRREASLTGRASEMENELRAARLQVLHQQQTLENYEKQLAERDAELQRKLADVATLQVSSEQDFQSRNKQLQEREQQSQQREQTVRRSEQQLEIADRQLARREAKLALEQQRSERELVHQRQRHAAQVEADRRQHQRMLRQSDQRNGRPVPTVIVPEQSLLSRLSDLDQRAEEIERRLKLGTRELDRHVVEHQKVIRTAADRQQKREKQLDSRQAAVSAMRESLSREQREQREILRETLDLRMAAEILFRQVAKKNGMSQTVSQWGHLRARLAQFRDRELAEQHQQRSEMVEVARRLGRRQKEMRQYRDQLLRWRKETILAFEQRARVVAGERA